MMVGGMSRFISRKIWWDTSSVSLHLPGTSGDTPVPKKIKKDNQMEAVAKLQNDPTSPRKIRLVADLIRGQKVSQALNILRYSQRGGADKMEKLLLSAIANWQAKNEDAKLEEADLFIKEVKVDGARMLKRLRPAPQGRAHRIRKRSNHVTLVLGTNNISN